jgi:hypothetical protein
MTDQSNNTNDTNTKSTALVETRTNDNDVEIQIWFTSKPQINDILRTMCHTDEQIDAFALPMIDIEAWNMAIKERQIRTGRPSYINVVLIQSRGILAIRACSTCRSNSGPRPFVECQILAGFWGGCCGNYKWKDHGLRYSLYNENSQRTTLMV